MFYNLSVASTLAFFFYLRVLCMYKCAYMYLRRCCWFEDLVYIHKPCSFPFSCRYDSVFNSFLCYVLYAFILSLGLLLLLFILIALMPVDVCVCVCAYVCLVTIFILCVYLLFDALCVYVCTLLFYNYFVCACILPCHLSFYSLNIN